MAEAIRGVAAYRGGGGGGVRGLTLAPPTSRYMPARSNQDLLHLLTIVLLIAVLTAGVC